MRTILLLLALSSSAFAAMTANGFATPAGHGILLQWTLSTTPGVTEQLIFRGTSPGGENYTTPLTTINDDTTTSQLDTSGVAGTTYYYTAEACITSGSTTTCSVPSNEASAVFPAPAPQTGVTATAQQ